MRHQHDTLESTSEYLRLALPYMSRFRIPVTPQNYGVWYEYVTGRNFLLKQEIDTLLQNNRTVDEVTTIHLYRKYVDPTNMEWIEKARGNLNQVADSMVSSLDAAQGEVSKYEQSLNKCTTDINSNINPDELRALVSSLAENTRKMSEGNYQLQQNLEASRRVAEVLRTELVKTRAEATTDALSGLANRKGFEIIVDELQMDGKLASTCLFLCDIDLFKTINDSYGHLMGDRVIKAIADIMKSQVKGKDFLARFGGEEFIVLLPETDLKGAIAVAESIRGAVEACRIVRQKTGEPIRQVTISIGVTRFIRDEDIKDTIARADYALYQAKENGRNRVEHTPAIPELKIVSSN
jgi:diguanylate cyclase